MNASGQRTFGHVLAGWFLRPLSVAIHVAGGPLKDRQNHGNHRRRRTRRREGAGVFPPFDSSTFASQLLWLAIAFGITYYVISKIAGPRISGILEDRHDRIASDIAEAERLKRETDEAMESYEKALADARSRAQALANETRDKLTAETTAKRQGV
jgi:hypothetical protein